MIRTNQILTKSTFQTSIMFLLALFISIYAYNVANAETSKAPHLDNIPIHVIEPYTPDKYDEEIHTIYSYLVGPTQDTATRIERVSALFLGKPYKVYPLGEGPFAAFDKAPLYRTDSFDCQTFVETVLAIAKAKDEKQFKDTIIKIRYQDPQNISFITRNHFMESDWNVINETNGYIKDYTHKLGVATKHAKVEIDKPSWFKNLSGERIQLFTEPKHKQEMLTQLHHLSVHVKPVNGRITYIPLDELFRHSNNEIIARNDLFDKIPSGAIIEIVRPQWDIKSKIGTDMLVSHLGFAIRTPQGLMYREASSESQKVIDTPLTDYLRNYYEKGDKTSVKGINIHIPT